METVIAYFFSRKTYKGGENSVRNFLLLWRISSNFVELLFIINSLYRMANRIVDKINMNASEDTDRI